MENLAMSNSEKSLVKSDLLIGMLVHSGIVDDQDSLLVLDPKISELVTSEQGSNILYEMGKLTGKPFVSFRNVQVGLNFNQSKENMIFEQFFDPYCWKGELIICSPNNEFIEHLNISI